MTAQCPTAYTVRAECADPATLADYAAWLVNTHIAEVIEAGAARAEVVGLDAPADAPGVVEVRYLFPDRAALKRYLTDHAPILRARGLARFPPERGIVLTRTVGDLIGTLPRVV